MASLSLPLQSTHHIMSSAQPPTASENDATAQPTYKDQLDEVADKVKDPDQGNTNEGGVVNQVVEKGKLETSL